MVLVNKVRYHLDKDRQILTTQQNSYQNLKNNNQINIQLDKDYYQNYNNLSLLIE